MTVTDVPLTADERRRFAREYTFTVVGSGPFPFDMLRYDRCTPKMATDSAAIERSTHPRDRDRRRVTLRGPKPPTSARWASFGWEVE